MFKFFLELEVKFKKKFKLKKNLMRIARHMTWTCKVHNLSQTYLGRHSDQLCGKEIPLLPISSLFIIVPVNRYLSCVAAFMTQE